MLVPTPAVEPASEVLEEQPADEPVAKQRAKVDAASEGEKTKKPPRLEDEEAPPKKKRRAREEKQNEDEDEPPKKKKKKGTTSGSKGVPLVIGGVVLLALMGVAGWVCYDQFLKTDETAGNTKPQPQRPQTGPDPKQPGPPSADLYDIDWRDLPFDDPRNDTLRAKEKEAVAELKKVDVEVSEFGEVQLSAEAGTPDGKIRPEVLQKLRVAGVRKVSTTWNDWQISDTGMLQLGQLRCLRTVEIREGTFTDAGLEGLKYLSSLGTVDLAGTREKSLAITGEGFRHLTAASKLTHVRIANLGITNEGLAQIGRVGSIEYMILANTKITDAGLVHLKGLSKLADFTIDTCEVMGAGCKDLSALPALKDLSLVDCPVTDDGVAAMTGLKVQKLTLMRTKVTEAAIPSLAKMTALKSASLSGDAATDTALKSLASHPNLERIEMSDASATDTGLLALAAAPKLQTLNLWYCRNFTGDGIERLKKAKSELKVNVFN
jgi:hypothetical protein